MSSPRDLEIINGNTDKGIERVIALLGTGENGDENALSGAIIPAQLLNDYKLYGVDSFVYNTPALWETLLLHPYTANDRWVNGDALEYVLKNPGKLALPAWLGMLSDTKAQASKFSGLTTAAQLAGNAAAMTVLAASETAMYALTGSETMWAAVVASSTAMKAVAGSEIAMRMVFGDEVAMKAVVASSTAMAAVVASSTAMNILVASETAMKSICENEAAFAAVAASTTAMTTVVSSKTAMAAVAASTTAMAAIAASKTLLLAIMGNAAAMEAIETSVTATAALAKSSLKTSVVYTCTSVPTVRVAKKLYLISIRQSTVDNNSYYFITYLTARNNHYVRTLFNNCYNRESACNCFMSELKHYHNYTAGVNVTYTYILLE